jgi:methylated-DNA-[protein]-cysteine S-methyltransferase
VTIDRHTDHEPFDGEVLGHEPVDREVLDELDGRAAPAGPGVGAALRNRLAGGAARAGLLDIAYRVLDSPIGPLLVAVSPDGLVRVAFEREGHDAVLAHLAAVLSPRILAWSPPTEEVARQLEQYFAGQRRHFELALDLRLAHGFGRTVLSHLGDIGYGSTASYASVARAAGNPNAVRAVGSACSHNPIPVVVPCHRVVRSDGSLGGYLGGTEAKHTLLALEGAPSAPRRFHS